MKPKPRARQRLLNIVACSRYIALPGQALAYKLGQLGILRMRDEARTKLGRTFDIKSFHDELLGAGALPMDVLEARMTAWAQRQAK